MNFFHAVAEQQRKVSIMNFNEFLKTFRNLPKPKYEPHIKHPAQCENFEIISHIPINHGIRHDGDSE